MLLVAFFYCYYIIQLRTYSGAITTFIDCFIRMEGSRMGLTCLHFNVRFDVTSVHMHKNRINKTIDASA
jgi:hypothetical protein